MPSSPRSVGSPELRNAFCSLRTRSRDTLGIGDSGIVSMVQGRLT